MSDRRGKVFQQRGRLPHVDDHDFLIAVVVQVSDGKPARRVRIGYAASGLRRQIESNTSFASFVVVVVSCVIISFISERQSSMRLFILLDLRRVGERYACPVILIPVTLIFHNFWVKSV